jgi:hypothetical protein
MLFMALHNTPGRNITRNGRKKVRYGMTSYVLSVFWKMMIPPFHKTITGENENCSDHYYPDIDPAEPGSGCCCKP